MIELPVARKFGGPEIALLAVACAFAVAMTAWWHGLYRAPAEPLTQMSAMQGSDTARAENVRQVTVVAYLVNGEANDLLPALGEATSTVVSIPPDDRDPNQTLLQIVAVAGGIAAAVYCLAVYPSLRRNT